MFGRIEKFIADRKGAFAIQFALMVVPLTVCTGLAIDGGRAFLARYELEEALDAAALAVGSTADGADMDAIAAAWVAKNFKTPHKGNIDLDVNVDGDVVTINGTVAINTFFMPLMGRDTVSVSAESQARKGGGNVEVALALDITASMSSSKIAALKSAAKSLVAEVVNDEQSPFFSRVAIAPWGTNLHVGSTLAASLRGPAQGPTSITNAHWRNGTSKTITGGSWKNGAAVTSVTANWRTGSEYTISAITKITSPATRTRITVSGTPSTLVNGDVVGIYTPSSGSADGSYASYKNKAYILADKSSASPWTFNLKDMSGNYVVPPSSGSPTNGTSWRVTECLNTQCQMRLSNSSGSNNLANGDYVHLSGFGAPYANLNNAFGTPWQVTSTPTAPTSTAAFINVVGPTLGNPNYTTTDATGGTIQECYTSTCEYAVTATAHGFAAGDRISIINVTTSGGGATAVNNTSSNTAWTIGTVTTNWFTLPGLGNAYAFWSSGGAAGKCYNTNCQVKITSASNNLVANDPVQIASVGGFTGANNSAATVASIADTSIFYLTGWGPGMTNATSSYSSNTGTAQCLKPGCQVYRFLGADGSYHNSTISNCVTERVGTNATTDVAPASGVSNTWLGRDYPGAGSLVGCQTANHLTPLTDNKTTLNTAIDNLTVYGSTAGQIGTAWGWYLLSDKWAGKLGTADYEPVAKTYPVLSRVMVLMTDGAFNTAHCNGVTSELYAYDGSPRVADSDRIENDSCPVTTTPFEQAQAICTAIKDDDITIYTIGFQVGSEPGAEDFLRTCASGDDKAYIAANSTELADAFKAIAKEISKLRLSK
jgi:Flp pilus assembly protein TadG